MLRSLLILLFSFSLLAETQASQHWRPVVDAARTDSVMFELDHRQFRALLLQASDTSPVTLSLPMPDGGTAKFEAWPATSMAPELAAKFPDIRSYSARQVDSPTVTARLTSLPDRVSVTILGNGSSVHVDRDASGRYRIHDRVRIAAKGGVHQHSGRCMMTVKHRHDTDLASPFMQQLAAKPVPVTAARTTGALRKYRLAVAATAQYSQAVDTTPPVDKTEVLGEIVTAIDRVNQVYEVELGITLELVANNDAVIFLNEPDGYSESNLSAQLDQNQTVLDNVLGNSAYDIGHVFSNASGGLAQLGVACSSSNKAKGATGLSFSSGDRFYIDLVAHELGHQFNADHSFNGTSGSCSQARNSDTAFEPGSGITIMSYAGICDAENITDPDTGFAATTIPSFHAGSIEQIVDFTRNGSGAGCSVDGGNAANSAPVVSAGVDYIIPGGTPFELNGSATDVDPDTLMYRWDEMPVNAAAITATTSCTYGKDLANNPLFRSVTPSADTSRSFPSKDSLNDNTSDDSEVLPLLDRVFNFRLSAFDSNGGVDEDDITVTVDNSQGPFMLLQPNGSETLDSDTMQNVAWNTGCTENAPVACSNVDIEFSTDGGDSYSTLVAATPNDGNHEVSFGSATTLSARIRVRCSDNIFFDISDSNFALAPFYSGVLASGVGGTGSCGTTETNTCGGAGGTGDDVEPNDSPAQAQQVSLPFDIDGQVNQDSDQDDYFSFIAGGSGYDIRLFAFGSTDLDLYLYETDGVTEIATGFKPAGQSEFIRALNLVEGERYYVRVEAFNTSGLDTTYTLTIASSSGSGSGGGSGSGSLGVTGLLLMMGWISLFRTGWFQSRQCSRIHRL